MMVTTLEEKNESDSLQLLKGLSFCVIDLETTGGNHQYDKIIEIGLIKVERLRIVDELSFLINPEIPIPEFIQKLTSIYPENLVKGPKIEEVVDQILAFMGDSILVAHNSAFDIPFFNSVLSRLKREKLTNKTLCTNLMTKNLIPDIVSSNLPYITKIFGIHHTRAHRALEDAKATAHLLIQYLQFFLEKNIRKVNQLYYPRKKFELDCAHFKHSENIHEIVGKICLINAPLIITFKGEKGIIIEVLPVKSINTERDFVEAKIRQLQWKTITVKMVGSFLQAFFYLNHHFSKLSRSSQLEIIEYLKVTHLGQNNQLRSYMENDLFKKNYFIISNHLIQEQFILYSLSPLYHKKDLVFRFPGHFQKLKQHIERSIKKMESAKVKKDYLCPQLKEFFYAFLAKLQYNNDSNYLLFSTDFFKNSPDRFKSKVEEFLEENQKNYNYPKEHL